jgi:hypothetical protein
MKYFLLLILMGDELKIHLKILKEVAHFVNLMRSVVSTSEKILMDIRLWRSLSC